MNQTLRRIINPVIRVLDEAAGLVEYVASNETLDCYREVIRADGWRFNQFRKNAPFVDSHNYGTVEKCLGKVIDFKVQARQLVETVQWAIDVPENKLAQVGWRMTVAGYLKAVSVGFFPVRWVTKWDSDKTPWREQLTSLGIGEETGVTCIYLEHEQIELSACILGANPDALARGYKSGAVSDADLDMISQERTKRETAGATDGPGAVALAQHLAREEFLAKVEKALKAI